MLNDHEAETVKTAIRELDPILVNGNPMISLKSVIRILTNYRKKNDNWDVLVYYDPIKESHVWWIGGYDKILKAKNEYEAEVKAKQAAKKAVAVEKKPFFLFRPFGKKS